MLPAGGLGTDIACCVVCGAVLLQVPTSCPGVPAVLLQPALQWADKEDFNETLTQLAALFVNNFKVGRDGTQTPAV